MNKIPKHIAIIMDGNGRWAKRRFLPRTMGHRAGMEALHKVVKGASELGIEYLTVYAFSTENWKRDKKEVNALMELAVEYFVKELDELHKNNVKLNLIGDRSRLPEKVQEAALEMENKTRNNTGLVLNVALNYGGRDELVHAVQSILKNNISPEEVNENLINQYLYTAGQPDPDILVRTGGEKRLSNFLLWQNSYAEFIFTDDWWPDCDKAFLERVIEEYQNRDRRFGDAK